MEFLLDDVTSQLNTKFDAGFGKGQLAKATPTWKGAPQWSDPSEGWSFKVRGRLQVDAGTVGAPPNFTANRSVGAAVT